MTSNGLGKAYNNGEKYGSANASHHELEDQYKARLGDHSKFDASVDYSVTFFAYDLQHYIDMFKADDVLHFLGQWLDGKETLKNASRGCYGFKRQQRQ